ncbi:MAG: trypsin-like peptidase domain-containing protein [Planctomycetota bacterium]|nr:trypsin-like peptidase domain-containing protein [Planctomycetota bacterium]
MVAYKRFVLLAALLAGVGIGFIMSRMFWGRGTSAQDVDNSGLKTEIDRLQKSAADFQKLFVLTAKLVAPSVVNIRSTAPMFFTDRDWFRSRFENEQIGSGLVVSDDGYILTNNHVVQGAQGIQVMLHDGREFVGRTVGTDPVMDLAVVKIDATELRPALLGDSDSVQVGDWVIAVGSPFGLDHSVTAGIVSAKERAKGAVPGHEGFLQTDAAINPGNSGGPLVNMKGEVVGINTSIISQRGGFQGIGFAIPTNSARVIMQKLIADGKVSRGYMGIRMLNVGIEAVEFVNRQYGYSLKSVQDLLNLLGLKEARGVFIADVLKGSPAQKGGLLEGDVITEFDGVQVEEATSFRNTIAVAGAGHTARVKVIRDVRGEKKELALEIQLGAQ